MICQNTNEENQRRQYEIFRETGSVKITAGGVMFAHNIISPFMSPHIIIVIVYFFCYCLLFIVRAQYHFSFYEPSGHTDTPHIIPIIGAKWFWCNII